MQNRSSLNHRLVAHKTGDDGLITPLRCSQYFSSHICRVNQGLRDKDRQKHIDFGIFDQQLQCHSVIRWFGASQHIDWIVDLRAGV